jgi:hypothetical protein
MIQKDVDINGTNFTLTTLGGSGFSIGVRTWREKYDKEHFIIKTVHRPFNKELFSFPHTPIVVGETLNRSKFSRPNKIRVLDTPIKFPDYPEYRLPKEVDQFDDVISMMISFEHKINPFVNQYYAYLTVDQMEVDAGKTQRVAGAHCDGFQGAKVKYKRPGNRQYIAFDNTSPTFYAQEFKTAHLDEKTDNFFLSFDEQADDTAAITFDPYTVVLCGAYTVHKSSVQEKREHRTFVRLIYDTRVFNRFGNTHNPLFDYKWDMTEQPIPSHLKHNPMQKFNVEML